jgi:hypothetical protein
MATFSSSSGRAGFLLSGADFNAILITKGSCLLTVTAVGDIVSNAQPIFTQDFLHHFQGKSKALVGFGRRSLIPERD